MCSPVRYELSSGYKPAPMDLSHIKLASTQEAMVDKLAENAHNVWARDRIRQGWTYGVQQVSVCAVYIQISFTGISKIHMNASISYMNQFYSEVTVEITIV